MSRMSQAPHRAEPHRAEPHRAEPHRAEQKRIRVLEQEMFARLARLRRDGWEVASVEPDEPTAEAALRALARGFAHKPAIYYDVELRRRRKHGSAAPSPRRSRTTPGRPTTRLSQILSQVMAMIARTGWKPALQRIHAQFRAKRYSQRYSQRP
jgi:hypothetical protein